MKKHRICAALASLLAALALPPAQAQDAGRASTPPAQESYGDGLRNRLDSAHDEVLAASAALERARKRQKAGEVPLPGERTGRVGGGTRLNEKYFERQEELKKAVEEAQARLDKAYEARNRARY